MFKRLSDEGIHAPANRNMNKRRYPVVPIMTGAKNATD